MTTGRERITSDRLDEPIRDMEFVSLAPPQMVMRQLVHDSTPTTSIFAADKSGGRRILPVL
jgi:hypothetical protein